MDAGLELEGTAAFGKVWNTSLGGLGLVFVEISSFVNGRGSHPKSSTDFAGAATGALAFEVTRERIVSQ